MLKYGLLSTSSIAPRLIAALSDTTHSTAWALASRNLEKAKEKAALWGVPKAYGSYEELIHDPEIDVVYVSMINSEHYTYAKMALECGHHVLCEKPFTLSEKESDELFTLAKEKGLFIMEAEKVVFLPVMQKIKEIISSGKLGRITMADFSSSFDPGYNNWFFNQALGGGPFYGNAIYSMQLLDYLTDSPVTSASGICTRAPEGVEDQFAVTWTLACGTLAVNKTSIRSELLHNAYLYGENGYVEIPSYWKARTATIHYKNGDTEELSYPCPHELVYEVEHVAECIDKGLCESPLMTRERTCQAIRVLNQVRDSFI